MKPVSQTYHLHRRNGVWHYRRRVPSQLVATVGKKLVQFSLGTASLNEAKKRRAAEDLKWGMQFEAAEKAVAEAPHNPLPAGSSTTFQPLSEREVIRLVQEYVEESDKNARRRFALDPPESDEQKAEIIADAEMGQQILRSRSDPRADEIVYAFSKKILRNAGVSIEDERIPHAAFAETVRRGLLELDQRRIARLNDDQKQAFFDQQFNPAARSSEVTFVELCNQFAQLVEDEAKANCTSGKWVNKQRANLALLREIIGERTAVRDIDYDACLRVRSLLASIPANRVKLYKQLPVDEAIAQAKARNNRTLSPVTQEVYLGTLRSILVLATKKRLIAVNPAEGLKPLKRETVAASARRRPFTLEQIKRFFESDFYRECVQHSPPFKGEKSGWRELCGKLGDGMRKAA